MAYEIKWKCLTCGYIETKTEDHKPFFLYRGNRFCDWCGKCVETQQIVKVEEIVC